MFSGEASLEGAAGAERVTKELKVLKKLYFQEKRHEKELNELKE